MPPSMPHAPLERESLSPQNSLTSRTSSRAQEASRPEMARVAADVVPVPTRERGERGVVLQLAAGDPHADADQALAAQAAGAAGAAGEAVVEGTHLAGVAPGADPTVPASAVAEVADVVRVALPPEERADGRAGPERQQQPEVRAMPEASRVGRAESPLQLLPEQADQAAVHDVERRVLDGRLPVPRLQVRDPVLDPRLGLLGPRVEGLRAEVAEQRGVEEVALEVVARAVPQGLDAPGLDRGPDRVLVGVGPADFEPPPPPGDARPRLVPAGVGVILVGPQGPIAQRLGLGGGRAIPGFDQPLQAVIRRSRRAGRRPRPAMARAIPRLRNRAWARFPKSTCGPGVAPRSRAIDHPLAYPPRRNRSARSFSAAGINSPQARSKAHLMGRYCSKAASSKSPATSTSPAWVAMQ